MRAYIRYVSPTPSSLPSEPSKGKDEMVLDVQSVVCLVPWYEINSPPWTIDNTCSPIVYKKRPIGIECPL